MSRAVAPILALALVAAAPAAAAAQTCEADRLAVRFTQPVPAADTLRFVDAATGFSIRFTRSVDDRLPDTWVFSSGAPLDLSSYRRLRLDEPCLQFASSLGPAALPLADGNCYGVIKVTAATSCWSLRVETEPWGYPFRVATSGRKPTKRKDDGLLNWNLEAGLPRQSANVDIFDRDREDDLLLSIPVTYSRIVGSKGRLDLTSDKFVDHVVLPGVDAAKLDEPNDDVIRERRLNRMRTNAALKKLAAIVLLGE